METKTFTYMPDAPSGLIDTRQGAINIYASMPCPMKVPFKQLMTPFVESCNAGHPDAPVYCPDVADCSLEALGLTVRRTVDPDYLPDIVIANNYEFVFEYPFYESLLKTGVFTGVSHPSDLEAMPAELRTNLTNHNMGVLCFGSRSVVLDVTVDGVPQNIMSWRELLTPAWEDQFTVHGHLDKATFGFMYFLNKHFGAEGIVRYAKNIADIKHFSQIIKRLNSTGEYKTAINILPDVATAKIPSTKKVRILDLEEGKMLSPMMLFVKTSKLEQCRKILDFFWSKPFRKMLGNGCLLPDGLRKDRRYSIPDFGVLATDYKRLEKAFNDLFLENLNFGKINERMTGGGICK
ncbi:MAG: ABC transporter substrate-binding protein [Tannerella sp.]|jgi:hypothetical protein|nr:ABC transporter substrate-binding protein [Tannerella sp.]